MLTKQQIVDVINALPEEMFRNPEAVIEEIILLEKIDKSIEAIQNGKVVLEEAANKEMEQW